MATPAPGRVSTDQVPPAISTRSRIPIRPKCSCPARLEATRPGSEPTPSSRTSRRTPSRPPRSLQPHLVEHRRAQRRHEATQLADLPDELVLGLPQRQDPGVHAAGVQLEPGPLQVVAERRELLDGAVVKLGRDAAALLLGGSHGPVEQPAALGLGVLDLPDEPSHARHHEQEEHGRGDRDDDGVDALADGSLDDQRRRSHQGGAGQGGQADTAEPGRASLDRLGGRAHRRVQGGDGQEHLDAQIAGIGRVGAGVVPGERQQGEQHVGVDQREHGSQQPAEGGGAPAPSDRQPCRQREQQ